MIPERSGQIVALEGHGAVRTIGVVRGTPNLLDRSAAHGIAGRLVGGETWVGDRECRKKVTGDIKMTSRKALEVGGRHVGGWG